MKDHTHLFNKAIEERLQSTDWDRAIASAVVAKIKQRNRIFATAGAIAAILILVVGVTLWHLTRYETTDSAYAFINAQATGVFAKVFPEARSTDIAYSYVDDHVSDIITTALLER